MRDSTPHAEHHHFAGASLGITARAYVRVGGLEPLGALEDAAFAASPARARRPDPPGRRRRVTHVGARSGRAGRGLAVDLAVSAWSSAAATAAGTSR